jgi:hypothetical protein
MKTLFDFIMWQWNKWQTWQRVYAIAMILIVVGFLLPGIIGAFLLVVGVTSLLSWLGKWAIWDSVTTAFEEFKKEQKNE